MSYQKPTQIHSFRSPEIYTKFGVKRLEKNGCVVFVRDITVGIPSEYQRCDVLYSEPSWLKGYSIFQERAFGFEPMDLDSNLSAYKRYLGSISKVIGETKLPTVLICGKQALKKLPVHDSELRVRLNGHWEQAYAWGLDISGFDVRTNEDLIRCLARQFHCVGDFSCGYGVAGRVFKDHGKHFVMSDINEKCITYVAMSVLGAD